MKNFSKVGAIILLGTILTACSSNDVQPATNTSTTPTTTATTTQPATTTTTNTTTATTPSTTTTAPAATATSDDAAFSARQVSLTSDGYKLQGFIWKPQGNGPFPLIVYNHGSEKTPSTTAPIYNYFTSQGYVVFLTDRRGHGDSEGPYVADLRDQAPANQKQTVAVTQLVNQVDDVKAGLDYAKKLPYVDTGKIALAGCSYGGIETLLTSDYSLGIKAFVDFAGASESWANNAPMQNALLNAVDKVKGGPVFFLQAQNDYNTDPSKILSAEMTKQGELNQMKIYPAYGATSADGHGGFCFGGQSVWGPDVTAFLSKYLQ